MGERAESRYDFADPREFSTLVEGTRTPMGGNVFVLISENQRRSNMKGELGACFHEDLEQGNCSSYYHGQLFSMLGFGHSPKAMKTHGTYRYQREETRLSFAEG